MIELAEKSRCTGCGACKAACPKGAISFHADENGFMIPEINRDACVECGSCRQVCHAMNEPERKPVRAAYAAQATDKELLRESTSGAIFPLLAQAVFQNDGVVYGCVWDEEYNAVFSRAENEAQIAPMKGSKYVWSWPGDVYPQIKADLEAGKEVLFAGLPCQVAGLKKYLRKEYANLFLMDCLCNGTPSPLAFHKYLETIAPKEDWPGLNFKFRDKNPYGVGVHITYTGQKRQIRRGAYIKDPYYYAFYRHIMDREACYQCSYGTDQRMSDFTTGDYWGIQLFHPDMDLQGGVSALLVNTEKAEELIRRLGDRLELVETSKENIGKMNNLLLDGKTRERSVPQIRSKFFTLLRSKGWKAAERKCLHNFDRFKLKVKYMVPASLVRAVRKVIK